MLRGITKLILVGVLVSTAFAQSFTVFNRNVQVHGFASQGFVYTGDNNWLTMNTGQGSGAFTDFGVNASTNLAEKLRVGAQLYDRNIGHIGEWRPEVDWALVDFKFRPWLSVRGGKVKTTLGLYNDTQDIDFLHTWAILPQSIYPTDLRSSTIAHVGGDAYGEIPLPHKSGTLAYTAYVGQRPQDPRGGYVLGLSAIGLKMKSYGGWVHGEDLRWITPLKGLMVGASVMNQHITGNGVYDSSAVFDPFLAFLSLPNGAAEHEHSLKDDYQQYYFQYQRGPLQIDGEYRREYRLQAVGYNTPDGVTPLANFTVPLDQRSAYTSAAYRVFKRLELGSYFSWYFRDWAADHSLPVNHVYDRALTARFDVNSHWNIKVEGHFMDGTGRFDSVRGFYEQLNADGLKPNTNAVVIKTGFRF